MTLTILIILTMLGVGAVAWGLSENRNREISYMGVALLILVGLFGWGVVGCLHKHTKIESNVSAIVLKEETAIHLSVNGTIVKTFTDIATYNLLKDKTEVSIKKIQWKSLYGIDREVEYQ